MSRSQTWQLAQIARENIVEQTGDKGGAGYTVCPKCGGVLTYRQDSRSKHVHARCQTVDCLWWME